MKECDKFGRDDWQQPYETISHRHHCSMQRIPNDPKIKHNEVTFELKDGEMPPHEHF